MKTLHTAVRNKTRIINKISKERITKCIDSEGVHVSAELNSDLKSLLETYSSSVLTNHGKDSFETIFWQQQLSASSMKNKKSIRWHPLIIKWCLYLHYRSSGAYEVLRSSGLIHLPSGRTLRDYIGILFHLVLAFQLETTNN